MAFVFGSLSVYPQLVNMSLIEWSLHPQFNRPGPYNFTVQFSRAGTPDAEDWTDLITVQDDNKAIYSFTDEFRRNWSVPTHWFYRIKLELPNGNQGEYYVSHAEPSWGSLGRQDVLQVREMYRQACLKLRKRAGSKGLLFKRKNWGIVTDTRDPDTDEVIDTGSLVDYGVGFVGGYYYPVEYWLEMRAGETREISQNDTGTTDNVVLFCKGLAWPIPRTNDFWHDCTTGKRYYIGQITTTTRMRHQAVTLTIGISEAPATDSLYSVPLPGQDEEHSHWQDEQWIVAANPADYGHWF